MNIKKVVMMMLFGLFLVLNVFADYTVTFTYKVPETTNKPKQNADGTWETQSGNSINLGNDNPNDPSSYTKQGENIPSSTTYTKKTEKITFPGETPPAQEDLNKMVQDLANKEADAINEANKKSEAAKANTSGGEIRIDASITVIDDTTKKTIKETQAKASAPIGDPVLLSSGTYVFDEIDISAKFQGLVFDVTRHYQSGTKLSGALENYWYLSIDNRIVRGIKPDAEGELRELQKNYDDTKEKLRNTEKQYENLKNEFITNKNKIPDEISMLETQKNKFQQIIGQYSLTESSRLDIQNNITKCQNSIEYYNQLNSDLARELTEVADTTLGKLKNEIVLQKIELEKQEMFVIQSKKELAHCVANREYNNVALRGQGFSELIEIGNDKIKVYDVRGSAYIYKLVESPHYDKGKNHYPNGSETVNVIPGDNKKLVLLPNGSMEWTQEDGSVWLYNENGILTKITNVHNVSLDFNYDADFYLQSISSEGIILYNFYWTNGALTKIENARDRSETVEYAYNSKGLLSSVKDTDGDVVRYEYSHGEYLTKVIKPEENANVQISYGYEFDGKRLVDSTTDEEGNTEFFEYSKDASQLTYTDHSGKITTYWYDDEHRTKKELHSDGKVIEYEYDEHGNVVQQRVNGRSTTYAFDNRGNKTKTTYSDGSSEQWQFNTFNKPTFYKDRDGKTVTYNYDAKGNVTFIYKGTVLVFSAQYNTKGLPVRITEGEVTTVYSYDSFGNVISRVRGSGANAIQEYWQYDGQDRVVQYTNALGEKTHYSYEGKTTRVNYPQGLEIRYKTNSRKDLVEVIQKDVRTGEERGIEYLYDKRHKLIETKINGKTSAQYTYKGAGELESELVLQDEEVWKKEYIYDDASRLIETWLYKATREGELLGSLDDIFVQKVAYEKDGTLDVITAIDPLGRKNTQVHDEWGRMISSTNALNETYNRGISDAGRLLEVQSSFGGTYFYEYNEQGLVSKFGESSTMNARSITYTATGKVQELVDEKGISTVYNYNDLGQLSSLERLGVKTFYTYDKAGRVILVITGTADSKLSAESWTEYSYLENGRVVEVNYGDVVFAHEERNAFGEVVSVTDGEGNKTEYRYNEKGQLVEVTDPNGYVTRYEYNALGKVKSVWDASSGLTRTLENASMVYTYNYMGLPVEVTNGEGILWQGEYDKVGRLIHESGKVGLDRSYRYDALDRITEVSSGGVVVERYAYTEQGRRISFTDGKGVSYSYTKDAYGRLVEETNRLGTTQRYEYEKDSTVKSKIDFAHEQTTIYYNDSTRTKTVSYADGRKETFAYNMAGNIIRAETKTGVINYSYNKAGLLTKQEDVNAGEITTYTYDKAGRRVGMNSGNREVRYTYGKTGELLGISDNKQRLSVSYKYDKLYREIERRFGNGVVQKTQYTKGGVVENITEYDARGALLRGEAYVYDEAGRRIFTVNEKGNITKYDYDAQSRLIKVLYSNVDEKKEVDRVEAEQEGLHFFEENIKPVFVSLSAKERASLMAAIEKMSYGRATLITASQVLWAESFTYDANGNRANKTTAYGTIRYWYDAENRLTHSGANAVDGSDYTYDANGNLLTKANLYKSEEYEYTSTNRMKKSVVTNHIQKTVHISYYDYDAFGRRTLVKDEGGKLIRTLYDGFGFDVIREQEAFADGYFTNTRDTGIAFGTVREGDGSRYRYIGDDYGSNTSTGTGNTNLAGGYRLATSTRSTSTTSLFAKGEALATTKLGSTTERSYFGKDILGSVRTVTSDIGSANYYDYDAFGTPFGNDISDYAYAGKAYDPVTGMYNYGFRDYTPQVARFSTVDPIRDGANWFAYCEGDPVNKIDLWGLTATDPKGSNIVFPSNSFALNPPDPFSGGGLWAGVETQVTTNPDDFHCDIHAWNAALANNVNPRGQNGENPDLNGITVDTWYDSFPDNRYKGIPPANSKGYAFFDGTDDGVENPTHIEYYDNTNFAYYNYIQYYTKGIKEPEKIERSIFDKRNQNWTYVPLKKGE